MSKSERQSIAENVGKLAATADEEDRATVVPMLAVLAQGLGDLNRIADALERIAAKDAP